MTSGEYSKHAVFLVKVRQFQIFEYQLFDPYRFFLLIAIQYTKKFTCPVDKQKKVALQCAFKLSNMKQIVSAQTTSTQVSLLKVTSNKFKLVNFPKKTAYRKA